MSKRSKLVRRTLYWLTQPITITLAVITVVYGMLVLLWLGVERYLSCSDEPQ